MVELEAMLCARVVERNGKIRAPVLGASCSKGKEHGLGDHNNVSLPQLCFLIWLIRVESIRMPLPFEI